MLGSQREELVDSSLPVLAGSPRDAEDHVEIHIGKSRLACCNIRRLGLHSAVPAAQGFEVSIVERLHAKTQAVATARTKSVKLLSVSRGGVRFQSNFGFRSNAKGDRSSVEYLLHLHRVEEAGRTTTKEHRLQRSLVHQRPPETYLCTDSIDVAVIKGRVPG